MLTEASFYGGTQVVAVVPPKQHMHPSRAFTYNVTANLVFGSRALYTPDVITNPWRWTVRAGRPMFMVIRKAGAFTGITIKRASDDATIGVVAPGQVSFLYLIDATTDTWHLETRTQNTARPLSKPAGLAAPESAVDHLTYTPFCYDGSLCRFLRDAGNEPLDGTDSDEVVAPVYQDPTDAVNSNREAIRAADIVMPKLIALRFENGCFAEDANHPWSGVFSLSSRFYDALHGLAGSDDDNGSLAGDPTAHLLEYNSALSFPTTGQVETSNPYHLRRVGSSWRHNTDAFKIVNCHRYVWTVDVPYGPNDDPERYTLQLRFQLEHTLDAPAVASSQGGGSGVTNTPGAWGSLCSLSVFTDELNSIWVEDSTDFQPADFANAYTWNRSNPIVCGIAENYLETVAHKGVHPQCVAHATLAMSWHAPIGKNHFPLAEDDRVPGSGVNGKNLHDSYVVRNGSPWTTFASCTEPVPIRHASPGNVTGVLHNCVFGYANTATLGKAITFGGGFPVSKLLEWLCWENGSAEGRTFLKPTKPGWNEYCGSLDVVGGNCGEIAICTGDGDNNRDGDDGIWPRFEVSPCDGHPDEPFETVGGSHGCFKSTVGTTAKGDMDAGTGKHCCVKTVSTTALFREPCVRSKVKYGDPNGGGAGCEVLDYDCSQARVFTTQFPMAMEDYDFMPNGNALLRRLRWSHTTADPDHPDRDYTYDQSDTSTLTQHIGAWTYGVSEITNTFRGGTNPIRALLSHHDTTDGVWGWWGCNLSGTFERTLSNGHGVAAAYEQSANSTLGIGMHVSAVDGDSVLVEVSTYDGATKVVLDSLQLDAVSSDGAFQMTWQGTAVTFTYTPVSGPGYSYTASWWHAALDSGTLRACLFSEDTTSSGAGFTSVVWNDTVPDLEEAVFGTIEAQSINATCTGEKYLAGFGRCEDSYPDDCGTGDDCNCTKVSESKTQKLSTTHAPSPYRDVDDFRTESSECGRRDKECQADWTADNPTGANCPSPARCKCHGRPSSQDWAGCDQCETYSGDRAYIVFPLPVAQECYKANVLTAEQDPDVVCVNDLPLICHGIAFWDWAVLL